MTDRDEIALRLFAAWASGEGNWDMPQIRVEQIRPWFTLADRFLEASRERQSENPAPPAHDTGGLQKRGM